MPGSEKLLSPSELAGVPGAASKPSSRSEIQDRGMEALESLAGLEEPLTKRVDVTPG